MSLQTQSFRTGWRLSISKKRAEDDQKRMSPQTQSCQLGRETLDFASWKKGPKNTQKRILEEGGEWSLESNKLCLRRRVSPIGGTFTGSRDAVLIESFADPLHTDSSRTQEPFVSCLGSASTQYWPFSSSSRQYSWAISDPVGMASPEESSCRCRHRGQRAHDGHGDEDCSPGEEGALEVRLAPRSSSPAAFFMSFLTLDRTHGC
jgi:hypothetical protein